MRPYLVWLILLPIAAGALWQLATTEPTFSPLAMGLLLFCLGGIVGLRLASDSATRFVGDLTRLNQYLAEQNRDLAELNHQLLKKILPAADEAPNSTRDDDV